MLSSLRGVLNKVLFGKALLRGPTHNPFIHHFLAQPLLYVPLTNGTLYTYLVYNLLSPFTAVKALSLIE